MPSLLTANTVSPLRGFRVARWQINGKTRMRWALQMMTGAATVPSHWL
jgi:hypothetical protein